MAKLYRLTPPGPCDLILGQAMRPVAIGTAVGIIAALAVVGLVASAVRASIR